MSISLYVFFEDPFWTALFTRTENSHTTYARVVLGQEPTDAELYRMVLDTFYTLRFHEADLSVINLDLPKNPKRRQKQAGKALKENIGTKRSYQLIKKSLAEGSKNTRKAVSRKAEQDRRETAYEKKVQHRKDKKAGH